MLAAFIPDVASRFLRPFAPALILAALAATGCQQTNAYVEPPPAEVDVAQPVERPIVQQLEFTGVTRAVEAVDVRARVAGYLQQVAFEDGAQVEAGQLLFVIEPEPYEAALDLAKAALQKAEATLALAEADLARTKPLVGSGALTDQELDVKEANVATAKADVASATASLRQATLDLSYTQVKSPIRGRASRHMVDVGNLVQSGDTVLTRVEAFDPIHVYFAVSESDVLELNKKTASGEATANGVSPVIYMGFSGEEGFPHEGRLDFADVGVDPQTGTQMRRGEFKNPKGRLVPGLFVRVRLPVGEPSPGLLIPDKSISADQRGEYVLVVNEKNVVEHRQVNLGLRVANMRVVTSGVAAGEWIVVNGLQRARPGAKVKPVRQTNLAEAESLASANDPAILAGADAKAAPPAEVNAPATEEEPALPAGAAGGGGY
jgi:RND family efflux transporter MFP subunit